MPVGRTAIPRRILVTLLAVLLAISALHLPVRAAVDEVCGSRAVPPSHDRPMPLYWPAFHYMNTTHLAIGKSRPDVSPPAQNEGPVALPPGTGRGRVLDLGTEGSRIVLDDLG